MASPTGAVGTSQPVKVEVSTTCDDPVVNSLRTLATRGRSSVLNQGLLLAFALIAINALVVARFQPDTAYALVRYTPPLALLAASMLTLGPPLLQVATVYLFVASAMAWGANDPSRGATRLVQGSACALLSFVVVDAGMALRTRDLLALGALFIVIAVLGNRKNWSGDDDQQLPGLIVLCTGLVVLGLWAPAVDWRAALERPHMPAEIVSLQDGPEREEVVGYVLDTNAVWTVLMTDSDRAVRVVKNDTVLGRKVCALPMDRTVEPRMDDLAAPPGRDVTRCPG